MLKSVSLLIVCLHLVVGGVPHGKNRHTGRITGGLDAAQGQFPYQASIRNMFGLHFCGGSILNENHILTAASCVVDSNPANIHVVVGSNVASSGTRYNIASISAHADYNRKTHENDIAVIRTTNPIYMSSNVGKVAIADQEILEGPLLTLGWGRNSTNGEATRTLQFLVTKLLPKEECKNRIPVYDDTICTFLSNGHGVCIGDNGGPLIHGANTLVGVNVFYIGGCGTGYPDGYVSVYYHRDWIRNHS